LTDDKREQKSGRHTFVVVRAPGSFLPPCVTLLLLRCCCSRSLWFPATRISSI
jgi:hypothetical protein